MNQTELPTETVADILLYLSTYDILRLCKTDTFFKEIALYINPPLTLIWYDIYDENMEILSGFNNISIPYGFITDEGLKKLVGVKTLNIEGCKDITDEGLKSLVGIENINLSYCRKVTDEGIKVLLPTIKTIDIHCCPKISSDCIKTIIEMMGIDLSRYDECVTDPKTEQEKVYMWSYMIYLHNVNNGYLKFNRYTEYKFVPS